MPTLRARNLLLSLACAGVLVLASVAPGCGDPGADRPTIAAATSLRRVMPALLEAHGGRAFNVSYASSGTLRRQIDAGAPYDLALFAGPTHADRLVATGLAIPEGLRQIATNTLILIGPSEGAPWTFASLKDLPEGAHLSIGSPDSVPAGHYARAALTNLGIWEIVEPRCVLAEHVGVVLALVRRGEVAAGIVYGSEIVGIDDVKLLDTAEGDWAPRPTVVSVRLKDASHAEAAAKFQAFLSTPEAQAIFERFGFGAP